MAPVFPLLTPVPLHNEGRARLKVQPASTFEVRLKMLVVYGSFEGCELGLAQLFQRKEEEPLISHGLLGKLSSFRAWLVCVCVCLCLCVCVCFP